MHTKSFGKKKTQRTENKLMFRKTTKDKIQYWNTLAKMTYL